jgi:transposase-like protein
MIKPKRVFDTAFKLEVEKLIKEQRFSVNQVCKDMKVVKLQLDVGEAG